MKRQYLVCTCLILGMAHLLFAKSNQVDAGDKEQLVLKNSSAHNTLTSRNQETSPAQKPQHSCKHSLTENLSSCQSDVECSKLSGNCLDCNFNCTCIYGNEVEVMCSPKDGTVCTGLRTFPRTMVCQYCYQTASYEHDCSGTADCPAVSSPRKMFRANCTVHDSVICMGNRTFPMMKPCNWTSGYDWLNVLIMSITLGGFGADRFYLGHWREGIGKLLSFGGLGVWTIIDVLLIFTRYLGPANRSLYMETVAEE